MDEGNNVVGAAAGVGGMKISAPKLDLSVERYSAYKSWRSKWDDYVLLSKLEEKEAPYQAAMLRYSFVDDTRTVYESLKLSEADSKDPTKILAAMETFAKGIVNETLERHTFNSRDQQNGESFDDFITEIVMLSKNCNFCECSYSGRIRDRIVDGIRDNQLREKLLSEKDLTEDKAKELCRAHEKALIGVAILAKKEKVRQSEEDSVSEEIDRVRDGNRRGGFNNSNNNRQQQQQQPWNRDSGRTGNSSSQGEELNCKFCLKRHFPSRNKCPAWGKQCNTCKKKNHFGGSEVCAGNGPVRSSNTNRSETNEVREALDALYIGAVKTEKKSRRSIRNVPQWIKKRRRKRRKQTVEGRQPKEEGTMGDVPEKPENIDKTETEGDEDQEESSKQKLELEIEAPQGKVNFKIDTGADVSVIGVEHLGKFGLTTKNLKTTRKKLMGADNKRMKCRGYFRIKLHTNSNQKIDTIIYVCDNVNRPLLGKRVCFGLKIVEVKLPEKAFVRAVNIDVIQEQTNPNNDNKFVRAFPTVFEGLGCFGDPVHIETKEGATPYHINAPRRVAIPLVKPLEEELNRMERLGVIRRVDHPTEWCHPMVVTRKPNGKLRVCIDLTKLNEEVKREFYEIPTVPETLAKIGNKCKFMSKLDFNSGYWQIPLDEDSQNMCTFTTPFGRYSPTKTPFGLNSMPEIFTKRLDNLLSHLSGVARSMDDMLIHGETEEEHDERLYRLLKVLEENGITLNLDKCKFNQSEVEFLGHVISAEGIKPLHKRVEAVVNFPTPTNITELKSFLGMAQQLSRFSSELANR